MAAFVFTDADININGIDLSDHGIQVAMDIGSELMDNTAFSFTARSVAPGLLTAGAQIQFLQDYASGKVDATIFPLIGTTFTVILKPTSAAVSATNPSYTATMTVDTYSPMGDSVGDQSKATLNLANAGSAGWARAV